MKYVRPLEFDARPYLAVLPELAERLPPGARAFATDPEHYDLYSPRRCVKDLKLESTVFTDDLSAVGFELRFRFRPKAPVPLLAVRYRDLVSFRLEVGERPEGIPGVRLGDVALDEILPHERGCSHEIAFHYGTIHVVAADLTATWHVD